MGYVERVIPKVQCPGTLVNSETYTTKSETDHHGQRRKDHPPPRPLPSTSPHSHSYTPYKEKKKKKKGCKDKKKKKGCMHIMKEDTGIVEAMCGCTKLQGRY